MADDLAEEQADRSNLVGKGKPSGGFHKRHLVRAQEKILAGCLQVLSWVHCHLCIGLQH